jgi:hypothetical protein
MEINCIESSSKLLNRKLNAKVNQMDGGARALTLNIVMLMVDSTWRLLAVIKHTINRYSFVKCPLYCSCVSKQLDSMGDYYVVVLT